MAGIERVAMSLHAGAIHLLRGVRREDGALGVGPARLSALSVLMAGPLTLGELAAAEQVRAPTMTRVVAGLESLGLVRRLPHPSDGRATLVEMTEPGRRLLDRGREARVRRLVEALATLGPAELAAVEAALPALEKVALAALRGPEKK